MEDDKRTVSLALELLGGTIEDGGMPECRQVTTNVGLKLQLLLPRLVDAQESMLSADLLLSDMESISQNIKVDSVYISGVHFTPEGVGSLMMFLAVQAAAVKHLTIHNVVTDPSGSKDEEQALSSLALAFQESRLESLDLSHNILGAFIWDNFNSQQQLESLVLEDVEMNDESYENLERNLEKKMYTGKLAKLCISNKLPVGAKAVEAGNNIIYRCTTLRSLRWLNKSKLPGNLLPCRGIYDLSEKMDRHTQTLKHVELEGGELSDEDFGETHGLCGAIKRLNRLSHLKLTKVGLTPMRTKMLVSALQAGKNPLRNLDLGENFIGDQGSVALSKISENRQLMTHLKYVNISANGITNDGGVSIFSTIGGKGIVNINFQCDDNDLSMSQVALRIAASKQSSKEDNGDAEAGQEKIEGLLTSQASMIADLQLLQKEVQKVTDERDTLIKAFSVLGASQQVDERNSILERLKRLEETLHGQSQSLKQTSKHIRRRPGDHIGGTVTVPQPPASSPYSPHVGNGSRLSTTDEAIPSSSQRPTSVLREQIRQRVREDVESLQRQKDETRKRILADVEFLQAERRRQRDQHTTETLQAKIREKIARKDEDRAKVRADVAKLREKKAAPKRSNSLTEAQVFAGGDSNQSLNFDDSISSFGGSFSSVASRSQRQARKSSELTESGKATVLVPDSHVSVTSDDSLGGARSSRHSRAKERNLVGQSTGGDRFQRLLHRQIQNQLYKSQGDLSLKSASQRSLVSSSAHSATGGKAGRSTALRSASFHVASSTPRGASRGINRTHSDDGGALTGRSQSLHGGDNSARKKRTLGSFAGTRHEKLGDSLSSLTTDQLQRPKDND